MGCGWQQKTRYYKAGKIEVFKRVGMRGNTNINHSDEVYIYIYTHTNVCLCIYTYINVQSDVIGRTWEQSSPALF